MRSWIMAACCLVFFAGCTSDATGPSCHSDEATFEGERYGFCAPSDWEQMAAFPTDVAFLSPDTGDGFRENINMVREPAQGLSLQEYVDSARQSLEAVSTDLAWIDDRATTVGGQDGWRFEYTARQGQGHLHMLQLVSMNAGHAHVLT